MLITHVFDMSNHGALPIHETPTYALFAPAFNGKLTMDLVRVLFV